MVKSNGHIVRIFFEINPHPSIFNKIADRSRDVLWINSDIRLANSIRTRPTPNSVKHGPVQIPQVTVVKQTIDCGYVLQKCFSYVPLLRFKQFASR
jgi:hypothetical protein